MPYIVVNYIGRKGGGASYSYEMTKGIVQNGWNVIAIIPNNIENIEEWKKLKGCKIITIKGYNDNYFSFLKTAARLLIYEGRKIKKACKELDVRCVYVPMIQPLTMVINRLFKMKKRIITLHDPIPHKGVHKCLIYLCTKAAKQADDLIVLSKRFTKYTSDYYGISIDHVHVIPLGIFDNYKAIYKKENKHIYDKDKINFLFFGRIEPYKGLEILAEAYQKLSNEFENVSLTIVGNGDFSPYENVYYGLKNITIINRWIRDEEVYGFFEDSEVITVVPYTEATQSGVIPVAMTCESYVICSNAGGLAEQVEDGVTGCLIKPDNSEALYLAMKHVVEKGINQSVIKNAKKYISDFSWDKLAQLIIDII